MNGSFAKCRLGVVAALGLAFIAAGCPSQPSGGGSGGGGAPADIFAAAKQDAEPGEAPFLDASKPILQAVASRDYATLYSHLSTHAKAQAQPDQFVPGDDKQPAAPPIKDLTQEQFIEWMGKMEKDLGQPRGVEHLYVDTIDPEILSGKGDRLEVMIAIGGMPKEIPVEIRKAAIRAQISVTPPEEVLVEAAKELGITVEELKAGTCPKAKEYFEDEGPYLNLKFVLVEEQGLKVGYFEFMGPSILD